MPRRGAAGKTASSDVQLMMRCLLKIKDRRETQLRKQIAALEHRQHKLADEQQYCQLCRVEVVTKLIELLTWQGIQACEKLLAKKQQMGELFNRERELATQQRRLHSSRQQLESQQENLQKELTIILKKKEKIRVILADERYQS